MAVLSFLLAGLFLTIPLVCSENTTSIFEFVSDLYSEKTCEKITCLDVIECEEGFIDTSGCCDICRKYIELNERCDNVPLTPTGQPAAQCRPGLVCSKDGICKEAQSAKKNSCLEKRKRRMYILEKGTADKMGTKLPIMSGDAWVPKCDQEGNYEAKQCKGKKCVCVDEEGNTIFGQMESELAENMTCACSRKMTKLKNLKEASWMAVAQIHCTESGDYNELQCEDEICYCADPKTGEPKGRLVPLKQFDLLPCYDKKKHGTTYLTKCEKELVRIKSLVYQFSKKEFLIIGLQETECDIDGSFGRKQCGVPEKCVCSSRDGKSLKSYGSPSKDWIHTYDMDCNCAFDEYEIEENHARYQQFRCGPKGVYFRDQCFDDSKQCFCIELDGAILREIDPEDKTIKEQCLKTDEELYKEVKEANGET